MSRPMRWGRASLSAQINPILDSTQKKVAISARAARAKTAKNRMGPKITSATEQGALPSRLCSRHSNPKSAGLLDVSFGNLFVWYA